LSSEKGSGEMWSRLAAFQLFTQANILIMLFDLDDPESLERIL